VPRHDIAAQVADGRLDAKPSRVLSYKDIREAHHIMEAAEAGKNGSRCGISPDSGEHPECSRIRERFRVLFG
jgi:hypothetical protein